MIEIVPENNRILIELQVNTVCNQNCIYCIDRVTTIDIEFDVSNIIRLKRFILYLEANDYFGRDGVDVCITGGEPSLYSNLQILLDVLSALDCNIELYTNGTHNESILKSDKLGHVDVIATYHDGFCDMTMAEWLVELDTLTPKCKNVNILMLCGEHNIDDRLAMYKKYSDEYNMKMYPIGQESLDFVMKHIEFFTGYGESTRVDNGVSTIEQNMILERIFDPMGFMCTPNIISLYSNGQMFKCGDGVGGGICKITDEHLYPLLFDDIKCTSSICRCGFYNRRYCE